MKVYLKTRNGADATAIYEPGKKEFIVLKGSKVSSSVSNSPKFRGADRISKKREGIVDKNNILKEDVCFTSSSTAANFVTGNSSNGLRVWKNEQGVCLKDIK